MRIFSSPLEMIREVERDLFEMGVRYQSETVQDKQVKSDPRYQTIELMGYGYTLNPSTLQQLSTMVGYNNNNLAWAEAEYYERVPVLGSGPLMSLNPGRAWMIDAERWEKFLRDDKFSYTYAERWSLQIPYVIDELIWRPNTRQAMMTMYDQHQDLMNWGGRDRVPCSISYQFIQRNGTLNLIYSQRSCDFIQFFSTDVYITVRLLKYVCDMTGYKEGNFIHFIGSLHAFAGDLEGRGIF